MKYSLLIVFCIIIMAFTTSDADRKLEYNNQQVNTTFRVDAQFYGKYAGKKAGFLQLNEDGTGTYQYDYASLNGKDCESKIDIIWGFLVDEEGQVVKFERPYGHSYPIIYNATGNSSFQKCSNKGMVDYILEYKDGRLTVSSSDDWVNGQ